MNARIIITIFATCIFIHFSVAQENQIFERKGFVFGASLGEATTNLTFPDKMQNDIDLAIDLKIGYMIKPQIAILLTSTVSIYDYSGFGRNRKRDFGVLAPALQYWLSNRFWVQGGLGIGGDNPVFWDIENPDNDALETKYYSGLGLMTSVGYEIYRSKKNFTIDVKVRAMYRNVDLQEGNTSGFSYGILVGCNFY